MSHYDPCLIVFYLDLQLRTLSQMPNDLNKEPAGAVTVPELFGEKIESRNRVIVFSLAPRVISKFVARGVVFSETFSWPI